MIETIVTNFGPVKVGPIFASAFEAQVEDLRKSRRTKAYKSARVRVERIEQAASLLAEMYWTAGKVLRKLP